MVGRSHQPEVPHALALRNRSGLLFWLRVAKEVVGGPTGLRAVDACMFICM